MYSLSTTVSCYSIAMLIEKHGCLDKAKSESATLDSSMNMLQIGDHLHFT